MKKIKIYYVIFVFLIIGCMNNFRDESVEIINITATNTLISFVTPTQTTSEEIISTQTLLPQQVSAMATQQTLIDKFSVYCDRPIIYSIRLSVNKNWVIVPCYTLNGESINIISIDELTHYEISYFEIYGSKHNSPEGYLSVAHWSQDGNYAYITTFPQMEGFGFAFVDTVALYRLDLNSGELTETISDGNSSTKFYSLGFSPNDRRLAYFDLVAKPFSLIIHDFRTGGDEVVVMNSSYNTGGNITWSENSKLIAFAAANYDTSADEYSVSVLVWDIDKKTLTTIIEGFDMSTALIPVEWIGETEIILETRFSPNVERYKFEINNKTLTPITP